MRLLVWQQGQAIIGVAKIADSERFILDLIVMASNALYLSNWISMVALLINLLHIHVK